MRIRVMDTEGDGLLDTITKFHIMVWTDNGKDFHDTGDYDQMREWLTEPDVLWVCHNSVRFDMPAINKFLGLQMTYKQFWDTLAVSWALFPERPKHGLEALGVEHGFKKPEVDNWVDVTYEQMLHRCTEDVKINWAEFIKQKKRLEEIYE